MFGWELPAALVVLRPGDLRLVQQDLVDDDLSSGQERPQREPHAKTGGQQVIGGDRVILCRRLGGLRVRRDAVDAQTLPGGYGRLFDAHRHTQRSRERAADPLLHHLRLHIKVGGEQQHAAQNQSNHRRADRVPANFSHVETP